MKGLGKGLDSLFKSYESIENTIQASEIKVEMIAPNPNQPRKKFDEEALNELSESIKIHGVIQPIVVNKNPDGNTYMIIASERRYRASRMAGLKVIPCIIKNYTEKEIKELSIIENLQREDLNPIETAKAIKELMDEFEWTQEEVATRLGKSRSAIANSVRLLTLEPEVIELIENGEISSGVARPLVGKERNLQLKLARQATEKHITARMMETKIKPKLTKKRLSLELKNFAEILTRKYGVKVTISGTEEKGEIVFHYYNSDNLEDLYEKLK